MKRERQRHLVVISAPSGTGKSTVCKRLLQQCPDVDVSISYTTRPPRGSERNGVEYYFVSHTRFDSMVREGRFLEWATVHGEKYGTAREEVERILANGCDVLLDIDVQGGLQLKKNFPTALLIFLLPPSFQELLRRLRGRGTEDESQIRKRIKTAVAEMEACSQYEFFVINDRLEEAVERVNRIREESLSASPRPEDLIEELLRGMKNFLAEKLDEKILPTPTF